MSGFTSFGSGQARNPQRTYEMLTTGTDGTQITSGAANTLGTYSSISTPSNALAGLLITFGMASAASSRGQLTVRASGTTVIVPDYHMQVGSTNLARVFIPLAIAASTALDIALRSNSASATMRFWIEGLVANSLDSPGYSVMEALNVSTGATRPGTNDVVLDNGWDELVADTGANAYSAFHIVADITAAPTTGQRATVELGLGAAASETALTNPMLVNLGASSPYIVGGHTIEPKYLGIPANSRLSARANAASTNTDNLRVGVWGFR